MSETMMELCRILASALLASALALRVAAGADTRPDAGGSVGPALSACVVTCQATTHATTGMEPFEVGFWGDVEAPGCNGWASFAWDFGDGATAVGQHPVHTYLRAGTYAWTMTVTVEGVLCSQSGSILVTPDPCRVTCEAEAEPASGMEPLTVALSGQATATECPEAPEFAWHPSGFPDPQQPARTNLYLPWADTYWWTLDASAGGIDTCHRSGRIDVRSPHCTPPLLGRWPYGQNHAVALEGSLLCFDEGTALVAADISDPSNPVRLGEITLPDAPSAIVLHGSYAFVADMMGGLRILDISNPRQPWETGHLETPDAVYDLAVSWPFVYLACGFGLRVIDASDPSNPIEVGFFEAPYGSKGVAVSGGFAYLGAQDGFRVLDIQDPGRPAEIGFLDEPAGLKCIRIYAGHAFLRGSEGIVIVDVSDPARPFRASYLSSEGYSDSFEIAGKTLLLPAWESLNLYDLSDPVHPQRVGTIPADSWVTAVAAEGHLASFSVIRDAVRMADVSDPGAPALMGAIPAGAETGCVLLKGHTAYVSDFGFGLRILDLSAPQAPVEIGKYPFEGGYARVAVEGSYAYLSEGEALEILDVSDPSAPVRAGLYSGAARGHVAASGGLACVGNNYDGVAILDVSNPSSPGLLGCFDAGEAVAGIALSGKTLYVTYWFESPRKTSGSQFSTLRVVDLTSPSAPVEIGAVNTGASTYDLALMGSYACVLQSQNGDMPSLTIVDVSDPRAPRIAGGYNLPGFALAVSGSTAYVADNFYGVRAVSLADPLQPALRALFRTSGYPWDVSADGELVCVADREGGVYVLDAAPCLESLACQAQAAPTQGFVPLTVSFSASATPPRPSEPVSYSWTFGDGGTSTEQNPVHTYGFMWYPRDEWLFPWTVVASAGGQTATRSGRVKLIQPYPPGDCDSDRWVSIGEVQGAVNMFLGLEPAACGADCDGSGAVSIGELQKVINAFLGIPASC